MVIATGDVEVQTDFEGTILSKGKVTVSPAKANITLCKNQNQLAKLSQAVPVKRVEKIIC